MCSFKSGICFGSRSIHAVYLRFFFNIRAQTRLFQSFTARTMRVTVDLFVELVIDSHWNAMNDHFASWSYFSLSCRWPMILVVTCRSCSCISYHFHELSITSTVFSSRFRSFPAVLLQVFKDMPEWLVGQLTTTANLETLGQGGGQEVTTRKETGRYTQLTYGKIMKHGDLIIRHGDLWFKFCYSQGLWQL